MSHDYHRKKKQEDKAARTGSETNPKEAKDISTLEFS